MQNSRLVIVIAGLMMLSSCENKSKEVSEMAVQPAAEQITPVASEKPAPPPAEITQLTEATASAAVQTTSANKDDTPVSKSTPAAKEKPAVVTKTVAAAVSSSTGDSAQGGSSNHDEMLALAKKSGCLACHKIEAKLIGPAWSDVSKRYKGDAGAKARLIAKVKSGGKGNWTEVTGGTAMPAYSPRVSDENIEKLVSFVLSL